VIFRAFALCSVNGFVNGSRPGRLGRRPAVAVLLLLVFPAGLGVCWPRMERCSAAGVGAGGPAYLGTRGGGPTPAPGRMCAPAGPAGWCRWALRPVRPRDAGPWAAGSRRCLAVAYCLVIAARTACHRMVIAGRQAIGPARTTPPWMKSGCQVNSVMF
jgi:hypothetical protein